MAVEIRIDNDYRFPSYAAISASFEVRERVNLTELDVRSATIPTQTVLRPWTKDYDALAANAPGEWSGRFDVRQWRIVGAYFGEARIGSAIVASSDAAVAALEGRSGCALLWDLRVARNMRGRGVGRSLLALAEEMSRAAGREAVDVETQDINVPACRLYAAAGYRLLEVIPDAYPDAPGEAKLIWTKALR